MLVLSVNNAAMYSTFNEQCYHEWYFQSIVSVNLVNDATMNDIFNEQCQDEHDFLDLLVALIS